MSELTDGRGSRLKMMVMQSGPVPPSGGPLRERYLDHHGRKALEIAASKYAESVALLAARAAVMPVLDFALVQIDDDVRHAIQGDKRVQWNRFRAETEQSTLNAIQPCIKASVKAAIDALNYLEDHECREEAHSAIHRASFINRGLFGCPIVLRDDGYWTDCPIDISHLRMGVSAGLVGDFECSICGELLEDCDHQPGQHYPKVAGRTAEKKCTICNSVDCEHPGGETFLVQALANARYIKASEVSFVARPRYPLARIVERSKDMGPLHEDPRVKHAAKHADLHCDADLGPCKGFNEMKGWHLNEVPGPGGEREQADPI